MRDQARKIPCRQQDTPHALRRQSPADQQQDRALLRRDKDEARHVRRRDRRVVEYSKTPQVSGFKAGETPCEVFETRMPPEGEEVVVDAAADEPYKVRCEPLQGLEMISGTHSAQKHDNVYYRVVCICARNEQD